MTCGIYMIVCVENGNCYIGSACNVEVRWRDHQSALRGGRHINPRMQNAWRKHGEASFKMLVVCECERNHLRPVEQHYIDVFQPEFNINPLADRPTITAQHMARIKAGLRKGERHTEAARAKMSAAAKCRRPSPATRAKMSASQRARVRSPDIGAKISATKRARADR